MDTTMGELGYATAAVDYAASTVASLRSEEADLPQGEELATFHRVVRDLELRHSRLAQRYQALSHAPAGEWAERWRAFQASYEEFLGRESRRRLEALEAKRRAARLAPV